MGLTSDALFYTVAMLTVVAVLGTLVGWNMLRGPRPLRWLARLVLIGCCQCTALAVVAVWVNDANGLYASWQDLLGQPRPPAVMAAAAPAPAPAPIVFRDTGDGLLTTYYHGPESGLSGTVLVWTPPEYRQAAYRDYRFPVIMLLHGVLGSPQAWVRGGQATVLLPALMRSGHLTPAVLVIPRVDPGGNTDCANVPGGAQTATWLTRDVPHLIAGHFRVRTDPRGWAVAGDSTGGYCAAALPLQYPKVFGAGVALGPDDFHGDPAVLDDPGLRADNDPIRLAARGAPVSILVATGSKDLSSSPANAWALFQAARPPTRVAPPLIVPGGGHNWGTWQTLYPLVFGWLSALLAPPAPPSGVVRAAAEDPAGAGACPTGMVCHAVR